MKINYFILRSFASLLALLFGFSAKVAAQYGIIETTYKIDGLITDSEKKLPIEGIKISMKNHNFQNATTQSDSSGRFEFLLYDHQIGNTYYFTAEDIDGAWHRGEFLPNDTTMQINPSDFLPPESNGHWEYERKYRQEINLKLEKKVVNNDTTAPAKQPPKDEEAINDNPIVIPKDSLLIESARPNIEIPSDDWTIADIFPNPTAGKVEILIESQTEEELTLQLFDNNSKALLENTEHLQTGTNHFILDLKEFPAGNYLLIVLKKDNKIVKKIIKL